VKPRVRACARVGRRLSHVAQAVGPFLHYRVPAAVGCGQIRELLQHPVGPPSGHVGINARAAARMARTGTDPVPTSVRARVQIVRPVSGRTHLGMRCVKSARSADELNRPSVRSSILHVTASAYRASGVGRLQAWLGPMHVEIGEEAKKGPALCLRLHPRARWLDEEELRHRRHVLRAVGRSRGSDFLATEDSLGTERNATGVPNRGIPVALRPIITGGYQLRCARS
jgi:hypothetical protein